MIQDSNLSKFKSEVQSSQVASSSLVSVILYCTVFCCSGRGECLFLFFVVLVKRKKCTLWSYVDYEKLEMWFPYFACCCFKFECCLACKHDTCGQFWSKYVIAHNYFSIGCLSYVYWISDHQRIGGMPIFTVFVDFTRPCFLLALLTSVFMSFECLLLNFEL